MSTPTTTPTPSKPDYSRLTPAEWAQVVVLWESGATTLRELSERYGISLPSLSEGLKKRGAVKGSRVAEFTKQAEDVLKTEAQRRIEDIKAFKNSFQKYGDFIMGATMKELSEIAKKPRADRTAEEQKNFMRLMKQGADILAIIRDQKYHLFDLYKDEHAENEVPEIGVTTYTEEELEAIRKSMEKMPFLDENDDLIRSAHEALEAMSSDKDS